jgi:mannosyltransferase OCH1-like enzyme
MTKVPKILHFIWVGDEGRRPDNCIDTWRAKNPGYEVRIWGNKELSDVDWVNSEHIKAMFSRELNGVADLMRYEILHAHGGIALDADSRCLRPLEDWLLEPSEFACWENEFARPGLIAAGCLGSVPGSKFFKGIVDDIKAEETVTNDMAWITVGPVRMTKVWRKLGFPLTIYPSHYFYPTHLTGHRYRGDGHVFAEQFWANTLKKYDTLHLADFSKESSPGESALRRNALCPCGSGKRFKHCCGSTG